MDTERPTKGEIYGRKESRERGRRDVDMREYREYVEAALLLLAALGMIFAMILAGIEIKNRLNTVPVRWIQRPAKWERVTIYPEPVCETCGQVLDGHSGACVPEK